MDIQLKQIWQPIAEGTENIETWWPRNEEYLENIAHVDTDEEVDIEYCIL